MPDQKRHAAGDHRPPKTRSTRRHITRADLDPEKRGHTVAVAALTAQADARFRHH